MKPQRKKVLQMWVYIVSVLFRKFCPVRNCIRLQCLMFQILHKMLIFYRTNFFSVRVLSVSSFSGHSDQHHA